MIADSASAPSANNAGTILELSAVILLSFIRFDSAWPAATCWVRSHSDEGYLRSTSPAHPPDRFEQGFLVERLVEHRHARERGGPPRPPPAGPPGAARRRV